VLPSEVFKLIALQCGIEVSPDDNLDSLLARFSSHGIYCLLVLDELDALYRYDNVPLAVKILEEFAFISSQGTGVAGIIACEVHRLCLC